MSAKQESETPMEEEDIFILEDTQPHPSSQEDPESQLLKGLLPQLSNREMQTKMNHPQGTTNAI